MQKILYFPTTPNFCISWRNRKPRNCIFLLECCMSLCQQTQENTFKLSQLNTLDCQQPSTLCTRRDPGREHISSCRLLPSRSIY